MNKKIVKAMYLWTVAYQKDMESGFTEAASWENFDYFCYHNGLDYPRIHELMLYVKVRIQEHHEQ